jgi:hypothetical protein
MFVISRNTAFIYRNKLTDTKQIGRKLGVGYVLEGSVRRADNRVRVNAQSGKIAEWWVTWDNMTITQSTRPPSEWLIREEISTLLEHDSQARPRMRGRRSSRFRRAVRHAADCYDAG